MPRIVTEPAAAENVQCSIRERNSAERYPALARGAVGACAFVQDDHLDPPILLPTGRRVVGDDRELRAVALGADPLGRNSLCDEHVPNGIGPLLRQLDVEVLVTCVVGVPFDQHIALRVRFEEVRQLVDAAKRAGPPPGLPAAKKTSPTVSTRPRSVCCALRLASSLARVALASSAARACVSARAACRRACSASRVFASASRSFISASRARASAARR